MSNQTFPQFVSTNRKWNTLLSFVLSLYRSLISTQCSGAASGAWISNHWGVVPHSTMILKNRVVQQWLIKHCYAVLSSQQILEGSGALGSNLCKGSCEYFKCRHNANIETWSSLYQIRTQSYQIFIAKTADPMWHLLNAGRSQPDRLILRETWKSALNSMEMWEFSHHDGARISDRQSNPPGTMRPTVGLYKTFMLNHPIFVVSLFQHDVRTKGKKRRLENQWTFYTQKTKKRHNILGVEKHHYLIIS